MTGRTKRTVLRDCPHCKHPHYVVNEPPYECSVYRLPTEPLPDYSARRTGDETQDAELAAELSAAFRSKTRLGEKRTPHVGIPAGADDLNMPRRKL